MKRVLTFLAIMLLPLSVMAMTPVTDSTLSDVTGQAGVDITNDLTMDVSITTLAWGDQDGYAGAASYGWVGISPLNLIDLTINGTQTIDVGTVGGVTKVRMGIVDGFAIGMAGLTFNVELGATRDLGQTLGVVNTGAIAVTFGESFAYISAHAGCGVTQELDITIDSLVIGYLSWGDLNGDTSTADDGYVGLAGLNIVGPITIDGRIDIDVVTGTETSVVQTMTGLVINSGAITAKAVLSDHADLATGIVGILGDIYISNLAATIDGTTTISAH